MKKIRIHFAQIFPLCLAISVLLATEACEKDSTDSNLGGDTDIALTAKDSVTTIKLWFDQSYSYASTGSMKVTENDNGMVTYEGSFDLNTIPDSVKTNFILKIPALYDYYKPKSEDLTFNLTGTTLTFQFRVRVTSEGFEHYFFGSPITIRYSDPLGTVYTATNIDGKTFTASVTEKTGQDDWGPFLVNYSYIKTSKIDYNPSPDEPALESVSARINHKFGLVNLIVNSKDFNYLEIDFLPYFVQ